MKKLKLLFPILLLLTISVFVIIYLYPKIHPLMGLTKINDKESIIKVTKKIADDLNLPVEGYDLEVQLRSNSDLIRQCQGEFGLERSNEFLMNDIPGYFWMAEWRRNGLNIKFGESREEHTAQELRDNIFLKLDTKGKLLELKFVPADSLYPVILSEAKAKEISEKFISKYTSFDISKFDITNSPAIRKNRINEINLDNSTGLTITRENQEELIRPHFKFFYSSIDEHLKDTLNLNISINNGRVSGFRAEYIIPEEYFPGNEKIIPELVQLIFYIILIISFLIVAVKRYRAYEMGFKTALVLGVIAWISYAIQIYLGIQSSFRWETLLGLVLGPLFIGLAVVIAWAVAESIGREVWKEKFVSMDLLINGHFTHSKIGENILRGFGFGAGLLAFSLLLLWLADSATDIFILEFKLDENSLGSGNYALNLLSGSITPNIFMSTVFLVFIVSSLRKKFSSVSLLIFMSAIIWGLILQGDIKPHFIGIPVELLFGAAIIWIFFKFDFLTSFLSLFTFSVLNLGTLVFFMQNGAEESSGWVLTVVLLLIVLYAFLCLLKKDKAEDLDSIAPAFVRHITERQRLQGELEVARQVQMSFLPGVNPTFGGVEIASQCLPAHEVGGDYYDFVEIDKSKLGIVIGDVSGKGTKAAFYMTLTKGFLKALCKSNTSPAEILIQMNNMFYENVERGNFISMIYCILDLDRKKLILARAGHNPLLVRSSKSDRIELIKPQGMALGLEMGKLFSQSIREQEIPITKGDTFVFYTDGFTEARNKSSEEFGETRLAEIIRDNSDCSANELLNIIFTEVRKFMGKTEQHDDMTIVIIKVH